MPESPTLGLDKPIVSNPVTALRIALNDHADILDKALVKDSDGNIQQPGTLNAGGGFYSERGSGGTAGGLHLKQSGDPYWRVIAWTDGRITWGDGTNPHDSSVARVGSHIVRAVDTEVQADRNFIAQHGNAGQTTIGDDGSGHPAVLFGTAHLAELTAGTLRTIGTHEVTGHVRADVGTSTEVTLGDVQSQGNPGIQLFHDTAIVRTTGGHVQMRSTGGVEVGNYDFTSWQDITAASFIVAPSARGDKENIEPITGAIDKLRSLTGYSYTVKASGKPYTGVMAEDMAEHFGHLVTDLTGPDGEASKAVDYVGLIAPLIAGTQENADSIDVNAAAIAALTDRVAALEAA